MLCVYECGNESKFVLKNGKNCCSKTSHGCQAIKDKNSAGLKKAYVEGRKDCSHFDGKRDSKKGQYIVDTNDMLVLGSTYATGVIKQRIIQEKLLDYSCIECNITDNWNGKPIVLELDHINGISNDNRLENLRFMCPNCHSQTTTFRGRGKTSKTKVSDDALLAAYDESDNIRQALIKVGLVPKGGNYTRILKLIAQK